MIFRIVWLPLLLALSYQISEVMPHNMHCNIIWHWIDSWMFWTEMINVVREKKIFDSLLSLSVVLHLFELVVKDAVCGLGFGGICYTWIFCGKAIEISHVKIFCGEMKCTIQQWYQTDRQADRQAGGQTHTHTYSHTQTDRQTHTHKHTHTDTHTHTYTSAELCKVPPPPKTTTTKKKPRTIQWRCNAF